MFFSPLPTDGTRSHTTGPQGTWDPLSYMDSPRTVTGLAPMTSLILVFHPKSIWKIRGGIPGARSRDDMTTDMFSDQMGCEDPGSICNWQENVIFANSRGVHLTDGATIRSLTDQGAIGDFWRTIFSRKRAGTRVVAGVYLDFLYVTILTSYIPPGESAQENLRSRSSATSTSGRGSGFHNSTRLVTSSPRRVRRRCSAASTPTSKLSNISPLSPGCRPSGRAGATSDHQRRGRECATRDAAPRLGWKRLGPEGVKRVRHVYVSHQTQTIDPVAVPQPLRVDYGTNVQTERADFITAGTLPERTSTRVSG